MIPRRRIDIGLADAGDLWRGLRDDAPAAIEQVRRFESAASKLLGGVGVRATASGRDAHDLILQALGIGPGDEIVIPAYTLGELVDRMVGHGLRPVAADVDLDSYCVTPQTVAAAITPRTRAVVALHCFGAPCDLPGIVAVAARHGLPVIEDCAHAFGAVLGERPVGSLGRAALFSLEVAKPVATFGGGLIATADADLLARAAATLDGRRQSAWPATRKLMMKTVEEFAVRSPAYELAARLMFRDGSAGDFERFYRRAHDGLRPAEIAFGSFQARRGLRRLAGLEARNRQLNRLWQRLAELLPEGFTPQRRDRHGRPAAYGLVARYAGDVRRLRKRAQAAGLDLAIGSEVLDDVAPMLGQHRCPGAARVFAEAVGIPLHLGIDSRRCARIGEILSMAARP